MATADTRKWNTGDLFWFAGSNYVITCGTTLNDKCIAMRLDDFRREDILVSYLDNHAVRLTLCKEQP